MEHRVSRVFDCIMFAGEADMLYFRLAHLEGKVERHIIVEATKTHRGVPRDPWVPRHLGCCLAPYRDRITLIQVVFPDHALAPWGREHFQRDQTWTVLAPVMRPDDRLLIADVDEIPSDEALADESPMVALRQRIFHSAVDWEYPVPLVTSVIFRAGNMSWVPGTTSISRARDSRGGLPVIENGGWHFSCMGTTAERRAKLDERTCHLEMPKEEWDAIYSGDTWRHGRHGAPDSQVIPVEVDETWPEYIQHRKCPPSWFRPRPLNIEFHEDWRE